MDMDNYKDYVDKQHAPEKLVELMVKKASTYEENKESGREKENRGHIKKMWIFSLAAAAFVICIASAMRIGADREFIKINGTEAATLYLGGPSEQRRNISLEDYDSFTGMDFENMINGYECISSDITADWQPDISAALNEKTDYSNSQANLVFSKNDTTVNMTISEISLPIYEKIEAAKSGENNGKISYASESETNTLYAVWENDGVYYSVSSGDIGRQEFKKLAKSVFDRTVR